MIIKINQLPVFATRQQVKDMSCNFQLLKNHKSADNSATTEAREKLSKCFGNLRILGTF
jgi:hypothetical protein